MQQERIQDLESHALEGSPARPQPQPPYEDAPPSSRVCVFWIFVVLGLAIGIVIIVLGALKRDVGLIIGGIIMTFGFGSVLATPCIIAGYQCARRSVV